MRGLGTRKGEPGVRQWIQGLMGDPELPRIIGDPRGPEVVTSGLSDEDLARLLDALYRNLDSPAPEPGALFWYEAGLEESLRRARAAADAV